MEARERSVWTTVTAATIRSERAARTWSREELAEASGIPLGTLRRLESGDRVQDVTQIARVAAAFGTTMSTFFERAETRLPEVDAGKPKDKIVQP